MNNGSISIERQSDTHAPPWMQAIVCVMSTMLSWGTMYSRSGIGCLLMRYGVTRWIFFQCTASMSTIRSRMTGMLPIGSAGSTVGGGGGPSGSSSGIPTHALRAGGGFVEVGVAGQPRLAVHAYAARTTDRLLTGAADADRPVDVV